MARFQTKVADLLDQETGPMPEYTEINWRALGRKVDVSGATLKRWYKARIDSDEFLYSIDGEVLGKLMTYFGVDPGKIVVVIPIDEENASPQSFQKMTSAATVATAA